MPAAPIARHTGLLGHAPPWAKTVAVGMLFAGLLAALAAAYTRRQALKSLPRLWKAVGVGFALAGAGILLGHYLSRGGALHPEPPFHSTPTVSPKAFPSSWISVNPNTPPQWECPDEWDPACAGNDSALTDWLMATGRYRQDYSLWVDESVAHFSPEEKRALVLAVVDIDARLNHALQEQGITGLGYGQAFQKIYQLSDNQPFRVVWATCPPGHRECTASAHEGCSCAQPHACQWIASVKRCAIRYGDQYIYTGMYTVSQREIRVLSFWNKDVFKKDYLLRWRNNFVHEFGHALDNRFKRSPRQELLRLYCQPGYKKWLFYRGMTYQMYKDTGKVDQGGFATPRWNGAWQQHAATIIPDGPVTASSELWADMFLGWTYGRWETQKGQLTPAGQRRARLMQKLMSHVLKTATLAQSDLSHHNLSSTPHIMHIVHHPRRKRTPLDQLLPSWR